MTSVTLRKVCKAYGDNLISKDVDLEIQDGEFVVLLGHPVVVNPPCYVVLPA